MSGYRRQIAEFLQSQFARPIAGSTRRARAASLARVAKSGEVSWPTRSELAPIMMVPSTVWRIISVGIGSTGCWRSVAAAGW